MNKPRRQWRTVDGVLLLDKPVGMSSNAALQKARRLFQAKKAGHTGSLDPLASGMLPVCFGEATKFSGLLLDSDKHYSVTAKLGERTATGDAEGEVIEQQPVPALDGETLEAALAGFRGEIEQVPPMYSALKHEGRRLYELAREGREVERPARRVRILELGCTRRDGGQLDLEVGCSKGTYIRTLVEDIAAALGTVAHVTRLHRTAVGPYRDGMLDFAALEATAERGYEALDALLLPVESPLLDRPALELGPEAAHGITHGQPVQVGGAPAAGEVRLYAADSGQFLGLGEIQIDGRVAPRRLLARAE